MSLKNAFAARAAATTVAAMMMVAGGCVSSGAKGSAADATPESEENAVVHHVSDADVAATMSTQPLTGSMATLYVNGLGCPLCATNIDLQLKRVNGVEVTKVDLSTGKVDLAMIGPSKPSPKRLHDAVADAGFTLVKIESR
jgi:copper chaperone CopZ